MTDELSLRARRHAALGDPLRLQITESLLLSDRSPSELAASLGISSNLLAHHLGVLSDAGIVRRTVSDGDHRRRYVRADLQVARGLGLMAAVGPTPMVFVCTHNSARSQLAAAMWARAAGAPAASGGTHPADRVRPGAIAVARRAGLDLRNAIPRSLDGIDLTGAQVVTVCDRAHEELDSASTWWHWSIPDPVLSDSPKAYEAAFRQIASRITTLTGGTTSPCNRRPSNSS
jgi:protein-tyrosine-phosphatase/DNA-binding transcriptional ArsR family regulator